MITLHQHIIPYQGVTWPGLGKLEMLKKSHEEFQGWNTLGVFADEDTKEQNLWQKFCLFCKSLMHLLYVSSTDTLLLTETLPTYHIRDPSWNYFKHCIEQSGEVLSLSWRLGISNLVSYKGKINTEAFDRLKKMFQILSFCYLLPVNSMDIW